MDTVQRTRRNKINKNKRKWCPVCKSIGTVGDVTTSSVDNRNVLERMCFCSNCLSEFDDRGLRVFNEDGKYLYVDPDYRYFKEG